MGTEVTGGPDRGEDTGRRETSAIPGAPGEGGEAGSVPWAMQIAVRYDKVHPARRVDVAEATARAVVAVLDSPQSQPGGPWHEAVSTWSDGRIRKVVRRARGKRWTEIQELAGVTVTQDGPLGWAPAQARAFIPAPVRPLPPQLAKTQVEGTHFPHGDQLPPPPAAVTAAVVRARQAAPGRPEASHPASDTRGGGEAAPSDPEGRTDGTDGLIQLGDQSISHHALVTIEVTPLHEMTSGKLCAQVGHAAQLAWASPQMPQELRGAWRADGFRVRVVFPDAGHWAAHPRPVSVVDAGFTEFDGPTETTRAWW